jgi:hypothetical protein
MKIGFGNKQEKHEFRNPKFETNTNDGNAKIKTI